jgi:hypothetical protein
MMDANVIYGNGSGTDGPLLFGGLSEMIDDTYYPGQWQLMSFMLMGLYANGRG